MIKRRNANDAPANNDDPCSARNISHDRILFQRFHSNTIEPDINLNYRPFTPFDGAF